MILEKETIKRQVDLLAVVQTDTRLRKVCQTHGGEWHGRCPFCGGVDRFRVIPYAPEGGYWACRQCRRAGDVFQYLRERDGLSFYEALKRAATMTGVTAQRQDGEASTSLSISRDDIKREQ